MSSAALAKPKLPEEALVSEEAPKPAAEKKHILDSPLVLTAIVSGLFLCFFHQLFAGKIPGPFEYLNIWRPWHVPSQGTNGNYILSDQSDQLMPAIAYIKEKLSLGEVPFWTHRLGFGAPFIQISFLGHLFPTSMLAMLAPIEFYWPISAYLRILLMALPTYYLLRLYSMRPSLSLLGSISLPFSLYYATWMGATISYSLAAFPLFFYAITRYKFSEKIEFEDNALLFASLVLLALSPFPAITIQTGLFAAVYVLLLYGFSKRILSLVAFGLAACCSCSAVLFYAGEYLSEIDLGWRGSRGTWFLKETASLFAFFPRWFGTYAETHKAGYHPNENINYVFILFSALIPAAWAIALTKIRKHKILLFWLGVQAAIFALSYNLFGILKYSSLLPVFDSNPSYRLNALFAMASAIVGVLCIEELLKLKLKNSLLLLLVPVLTTLAVIGAAAELGIPRGNNNHLFIQLGIFAVCIGALALALRYNKLQPALIGLIGAVFFVHSVFLGSDYNSYYTKESFFPETNTIKYLQEQTETERHKVITVGRNLIPHTGLTRNIATIDSHWFLFGDQVQVLRRLNSDYRTRTHTQDFFDPFSLTEHDPLLDFLKIRSVLAFNDHLPSLDITEGEHEVHGPGNGMIVVNNTNFTESCLSDECTLNELDYKFVNNGIAIGGELRFGDVGELPVGFYPGWRVLSGQVELFRTSSDLLGFKVVGPSDGAFLHFRPRFIYPLTVLSVFGLLAGLYLCFRLRQAGPSLS